MKNRQGCLLGFIAFGGLIVLGLAIVLGVLLFGDDGLLLPETASVQHADVPAVDRQPIAFSMASPMPTQPPAIVAAPTSTPLPLPEVIPSPTPLPTATPTMVILPPTDTPVPLPTATVSVAAMAVPTLAPVSPSPLTRPLDATELATRLVIPSLGVDAPVLLAPIENELWKVEHLTQEVGHLQLTGSPGNIGNVVLAGHVTLEPDGRPGPFLGLGKILHGDTVTVYKNDQPFTYQVTRLFSVKPTNVEVAYPTDTPTLTLITCLNYDKQAGQYADRLVVVAQLLEN